MKPAEGGRTSHNDAEKGEDSQIAQRGRMGSQLSIFVQLAICLGRRLTF